MALHPEFEYAAYEAPAGSGEVLILARRLAPVVFEAAGITEYNELVQVDPANLEKRRCKHPLYDRDSLLAFALEHWSTQTIPRTMQCPATPQ